MSKIGRSSPTHELETIEKEVLLAAHEGGFIRKNPRRDKWPFYRFNGGQRPTSPLFSRKLTEHHIQHAQSIPPRSDHLSC